MRSRRSTRMPRRPRVTCRPGRRAAAAARARTGSRAAAALAAAALALAGCGIRLPAPPPAHSTTASTDSTTAPAAPGTTPPAPHGNEVPTPPAKAEHAPGARTPAAAITAFADAYINWTAADIAKHLSALARTSVGQARSELQLQAAETRADRELHRGGVANAGTVESVAPLRGARGSRGVPADREATSARHAQSVRYVVVTLERTTASASTAYEGLAPAWHVTLAAVRAIDHGRRWVVSGWQPES